MRRGSIKLTTLISDIENLSIEWKSNVTDKQYFELWQDPVLTTNLEGNIGALFVRAILNNLGIDEHRVLKLRIENKYRQYQILHYYAPGCMPFSIGISELDISVIMGQAYRLKMGQAYR